MRRRDTTAAAKTRMNTILQIRGGNPEGEHMIGR
jgi:hypothetical protein